MVNAPVSASILHKEIILYMHVVNTKHHHTASAQYFQIKRFKINFCFLNAQQKDCLTYDNNKIFTNNAK